MIRLFWRLKSKYGVVEDTSLTLLLRVSFLLVMSEIFGGINSGGYNLFSELAPLYEFYFSNDDDSDYGVLRDFIRNNVDESHETILDVGCGTGLFFDSLERDFSCIGLDMSRSMLSEAVSQREYSRFVQGDMRDIPLEDRSVDVVSSFGSSFSYLDSQEELYRASDEVYRVLDDGGRFIFNRPEDVQDVDCGKMIKYVSDGETYAVKCTATSHPIGNRKTKVTRVFTVIELESSRSQQFSSMETVRLHNFEKHKEYLEDIGFSQIELSVFEK